MKKSVLFSESFQFLEVNFSIYLNRRVFVMYAIDGQRRSRLTCSSVQSDLSILCSSTYTTVSTDSVSGQ